MKKKKKKEPKPYKVEITREDKIDRALSRMRHKELQQACIMRGIEFEEVVEFDHHDLANWFFHHFDNAEELAKLDEYDIWLEQKLQERGHKKGDAILSPSLRFGITPDMTKIKPSIAAGKIQTSEPNISTEPKIKREADPSTGVITGTKKNMTYQLTDLGIPLSEIIEKVKDSFPDAQEKSIKIWHKRRLNEKE